MSGKGTSYVQFSEKRCARCDVLDILENKLYSEEVFLNKVNQDKKDKPILELILACTFKEYTGYVRNLSEIMYDIYMTLMKGKTLGMLVELIFLPIQTDSPWHLLLVNFGKKRMVHYKVSYA